METLAHQVLLCLELNSNAITRNWEPLASPSQYVGQGEQIEQLALSLNIPVSSFSEKVTETVNYLKILWKNPN
jgi:hypothetical protein